MAHSCGLSEMCLGINFLCPMSFGGLFLPICFPTVILRFNTLKSSCHREANPSWNDHSQND